MGASNWLFGQVRSIAFVKCGLSSVQTNLKIRITSVLVAGASSMDLRVDFCLFASAASLISFIATAIMIAIACAQELVDQQFDVLFGPRQIVTFGP